MLDDLRETKASLDRMRPWQVIMICCVVAAFFCYYGPRQNDDVNKASQLAVLASLKAQAIESCNETAKENEEKIVFATEKASFNLKLDRQADLPAVEVRQGDYICFAPQGTDAEVGYGEN